MPFNMNKKHFTPCHKSAESTTDSRRQRIRPKCSACARNPFINQPVQQFSCQYADDHFTAPNHTHNTMIPANKHMPPCVFIIKLELLKNQDYSCSAFAN